MDLTIAKQYWAFELIVLIIFIIALRVKVRGYFWKDKAGNHLSFKEFIKRWKKGAEGITYMQQLRTQILGNWINITGIITGIVFTWLAKPEDMWVWMEIILFGSLILMGVSMLSVLQKYWNQKKIEDTLKELQKENVTTNR